MPAVLDPRPLESSLVGLVLARCVRSGGRGSQTYDVDQVLRELGLATGQQRESLLAGLHLWAMRAGATIVERAGYASGQLLLPTG
jgi:hypothetical protein